MRKLAGLIVALAAADVASGAPAVRPRITGIAHVTFRISDKTRARAFYETLLGYEMSPRDSEGPWAVVINERQRLELRPGLKAENDRLQEIGFDTDDVVALGRWLDAHSTGAPVSDPEGRPLRFETTRRGGHAPATAISSRILHVGTLIGDLPAADRFYAGVLGLQEIWRGSRSGTELSWTNMKVPEGDDYVEFMLYAQLPAPGARGTPHHICLEVKDIEKAKSVLAERAEAANYTRPLEVRVGTNRKRQLNLYDPDGTRVELMEPVTVDGQPVPSSSAPPPRRTP
jgi:lactoylglutathione lyase